VHQPSIPAPALCFTLYSMDKVVSAGWAYTDAMTRLLEQYKQRFTHVWMVLERDTNSGGGRDFGLEELYPGLDKDAAMVQLGGLQKWLKAQPLARRPLIKISSKVSVLFCSLGLGFKYQARDAMRGAYHLGIPYQPSDQYGVKLTYYRWRARWG
jgi:hypothetical protein